MTEEQRQKDMLKHIQCIAQHQYELSGHVLYSLQCIRDGKHDDAEVTETGITELKKLRGRIMEHFTQLGLS